MTTDADIPAREYSGNTVSIQAYVYAILAGNDGPVKIGRALDPKARLEELKTGHYDFLRLKYSVSCTGKEAPAIERQAHILLAYKRMRGEWFDVSVEEATAAIDEAVLAVRSGAMKFPERLKRNEPLGEIEVGGGELVSDEEATAILKDVPGFWSEHYVGGGRFFDLWATVLRQHFKLSRCAGKLARVVVEAATKDEALVVFRLDFNEIRSYSCRIESWELDAAVIELMRHRLLYVTSEKDVYKINRRFLAGQKSVRLVTVYECVKKDAAA